jgi:hypothetical protein
MLGEIRGSEFVYGRSSRKFEDIGCQSEPTIGFNIHRVEYWVIQRGSNTPLRISTIITRRLLEKRCFICALRIHRSGNGWKRV